MAALLLALAGLSSAAVLSTFGIVHADAAVSGPILYAGTGDGPGAADGPLLVNERPSDTGFYTIDGTGTVAFGSDVVTARNFSYTPTVQFTVRVSTDDSSEQRPLRLSFGYVDTNGAAHEVCYSRVDDVAEELTTYIASCTGDESMTHVRRFYYEVKGADGFDAQYTISVGNALGYTRTEVNPQ